MQLDGGDRGLRVRRGAPRLLVNIFLRRLVDEDEVAQMQHPFEQAPQMRDLPAAQPERRRPERIAQAFKVFGATPRTVGRRRARAQHRKVTRRCTAAARSGSHGLPLGVRGERCAMAQRRLVQHGIVRMEVALHLASRLAHAGSLETKCRDRHRDGRATLCVEAQAQAPAKAGRARKLARARAAESLQHRLACREKSRRVAAVATATEFAAAEFAAATATGSACERAGGAAVRVSRAPEPIGGQLHEDLRLASALLSVHKHCL